MKISIEYCYVWNYYPQAAGLADEIKQSIDDVTIEFIKGSGGVFEVVRDGELIFSKAKEGRFPQSPEILAKLK